MDKSLIFFIGGISTAHHPSWTTEVNGVWREIDSNDSHSWIGNLTTTLYTLVSARMSPLSVWYVGRVNNSK